MNKDLEQFRKAQNADLAERVKEIRAAHPAWDYDRAFKAALEQNPDLSQVTASGFAKTPCGSMLAMATEAKRAQAESLGPKGQTSFVEQGGWQASRKRTIKELEIAAKSALTPAARDRLTAWIARLNAAGSQIDYERELANPGGELATARHALVMGVEPHEDPYDDPWYH